MQIAKVQESLARKALEQPNLLFENLFRYVSHPHWLWVAAESILQNSGAHTPGIDGITKANTESSREFAQQLSEELKTQVYRPKPVRRVYVPKTDGKMRLPGISIMRDRVIQEAVRMVLEPILESHFLNCSVGFRPQRRLMDAIHLITRFTNNNVKMWWVVKGEIKGCFDNIPHRKLMGALRQYVKDEKFLALVASFLSAGIWEKGKVSKPNSGVSQAGVVSPLLTNTYLHEMDKAWYEKYGKLTEGQKTYRRVKGLGNVQLVRYADDFVVLTNGTKEFAHELRLEFGEILTNLGLELSDEIMVTHVNDGFDFLGFHLKRVYSQQTNKQIMLVKPSSESIAKYKVAVDRITDRSTIGDDLANKIKALNAIVEGWANYYRHGNVGEEFRDLASYTHMRMYYWLKAKHSNMSARQSVKKYVMAEYKTTYSKTGTWGCHGVKLIPMTAIERNYYRINWPERNPYLEHDKSSLVYHDEAPIPDERHI